MPTNQEINRHLKTIAKEAGIDKTVTFHGLRHITFSYPLKTRNLQILSAWQVTIRKLASFSILQCSALIKRTLFSCAKVVFFSLITKTIPLKNGENRTSKYNFYHPSILKVMWYSTDNSQCLFYPDNRDSIYHFNDKMSFVCAYTFLQSTIQVIMYRFIVTHIDFSTEIVQYWMAVSNILIF